MCASGDGTFLRATDRLFSARHRGAARGEGATARGERYFTANEADARADGGLGPRERPPEGGMRFALYANLHEPTSPSRVYAYCLYLASLSHTRAGGLCVHSGAVGVGDRGYLFLGPSEAGKSTVTRFGFEAGFTGLGDDLNLLVSGRRGFRICAVPGPVPPAQGYSGDTPHLRAIFRLHKADVDHLEPIPQHEAAEGLTQAILQHPQAAQIIYHTGPTAFATACTIARTVPTYALHFRKSADFWSLIHDVESR